MAGLFDTTPPVEDTPSTDVPPTAAEKPVEQADTSSRKRKKHPPRGPHTPSVRGPDGHWQKDPTPLENWRPEWRPRKRDAEGKLTKDMAEKVREVEALGGRAAPEVPDLPRDEKTGKAIRCKETLDALIEWVTSGGTVQSFAAVARVRDDSVWRWLRASPEYAEKLKDARSKAADAMADEMLEIASTPMLLEETYTSYDGAGNVIRQDVKKQDAVAARKLAVNARQFLMAKWAPDRYGEKVEVTRGTSDDIAIIAARRRLQSGEE